jgi:RecB family endonuclease NucS
MKNEEEQLEDWLFENPDAIEAGLRWVKRQYELKWRGESIGRIDLLGVDINNNIVIVELKANEFNHKDYSQGLCYYRTISTHQDKNCRLVFVGKSMSTRFRIVNQLINENIYFPIDIYTFQKTLDGYEILKYSEETEGKIILFKEGFSNLI